LASGGCEAKTAMTETNQDQWARWLLHRRHGGDPEQQKAVFDDLYPVRDHVLRNARLVEGETLLDVGTGDGLIALGALAEVGAAGKVIFSDISWDLVEHCRGIVQHMGALDQSRFLLMSAASIALQDASVDAITTRSVLIYVKAKQQAFQEFFRVLKPSGRLSIFEPINRYFGYPLPDDTFIGYDVTPVLEIARKIKSIYERIQPPTDPMLDFDERDLLDFARAAGFREVHLELQVTIKPGTWHRGWDACMRASGNPRIPSLQEAMEQALTPEETEQFVAHLRPLVEKGEGVWQEAVAYLWAVKDEDKISK
jgi:ubiquinone/menaquinone biosynthesis C-methylase UbiE